MLEPTHTSSLCARNAAGPAFSTPCDPGLGHARTTVGSVLADVGRQTVGSPPYPRRGRHRAPETTLRWKPMFIAITFTLSDLPPLGAVARGVTRNSVWNYI